MTRNSPGLQPACLRFACPFGYDGSRIERDDVDASEESVNRQVNPPQLPIVSAKPEFSDGDGTQTQLRAGVTGDVGSDFADATKSEADGVGVEHEEWDGSTERVLEFGDRQLLGSG